MLRSQADWRPSLCTNPNTHFAWHSAGSWAHPSPLPLPLGALLCGHPSTWQCKFFQEEMSPDPVLSSVQPALWLGTSILEVNPGGRVLAFVWVPKP